MKDEILNQLQTELKEAMLAKDENKKLIIRVIISEINYAEKLDTVKNIDEEVLRILKKLRENAKEMNNQFEIDYISKYLPEIMNKSELEDLIKTIISDNNCTSMKDMGVVMKLLKDKFNGLYDGKQASDIVRKLLT